MERQKADHIKITNLLINMRALSNLALKVEILAKYCYNTEQCLLENVTLFLIEH